MTERLAAIDEVTCAVWMHDVVYDPRRSGNETRSAAFTREVLWRLGAPTTFVEEAVRLVESTAHHDPDVGDRNGQVLADADLAILGAPADRYERYARDVRTEYVHLSDDDWRSGRAAVVSDGFSTVRCCSMPGSCATSANTQARANLRAELATLAAP